MCPSNGADLAEHMFNVFGSTFDSGYQEISCLPSLGDSINLTPIGSPSMYLYHGELGSSENVFDDIIEAKQLETGLECRMSQTWAAEERRSEAAEERRSEAAEERRSEAAVIPLTVLELDKDDAANTSLESASAATTSRCGPNQSKRVRRGERCSLPSPLSLSEGPKASHFSVTSPPKDSLLFCGNGDTGTVKSHSVMSDVNDVKAAVGPWLREAGGGNYPVKDKHCRCGNSGNPMATEPTAEETPEVPDWKLERRREQNRKAAYRCRNKRKQEEDQLLKDLELTTKDNLQKRQEIQNLLSQLKRLNSELQRHTSTDHCFIQAPQLHV